MSKLEKFTNSKFKLLAYMYDNKLKNNLIVATQDEMAVALGVSRATINRIIIELREEGYIDADGPHFGRYILTDSAINIVKTFKLIEKK